MTDIIHNYIKCVTDAYLIFFEFLISISSLGIKKKQIHSNDGLFNLSYISNFHEINSEKKEGHHFI